ncbi:MAG: class I SAM-dependent methyltransferase [Actinobacteria bacterium]|nr:class I SAM-dependent methyltransferase [Actinomycetota bacterium]
MRRTQRRKTWPDHLEPVRSVRGWLSPEQADLLYREAAAVDQGCIVEVGSYRGRSTIALALGAQAGGKAPIYAIEPHEEFRGPLGGEFGPEDRGAFYRNMLRTGVYPHVRLVNLTSRVVTPGWNLPVGLLWIDGDHNYDAVREDFLCWLPHLVPGASVIFDDATRGEVGPERVVAEAQAEHGFTKTAEVGKVVALRAPAGSAG